MFQTTNQIFSGKRTTPVRSLEIFLRKLGASQLAGSTLWPRNFPSLVCQNALGHNPLPAATGLKMYRSKVPNCRYHVSNIVVRMISRYQATYWACRSFPMFSIRKNALIWEAHVFGKPRCCHGRHRSPQGFNHESPSWTARQEGRYNHQLRCIPKTWEPGNLRLRWWWDRTQDDVMIQVVMVNLLKLVLVRTIPACGSLMQSVPFAEVQTRTLHGEAVSG